MGASINLPVMLNQAPHVQKVQHAEQSSPEYQQVVVGQEAVEKSKREKTKVAKIDKGKGGLSVKKDKENKNGQSFSQARDREKQPSEEETEYVPESGRILDLTV